MKKKILLVMPLMAISLLASCGCGNASSTTHKINFGGGEYLTIDKTECKDRTELLAKISLKDQYLNNYEVPQVEDYYTITCNDKEIEDFRIYSSQNHNSVYLEIPKEEVTGDVNIKTEGYCHFLTFTGETDESKIYYYYPKSAPTLPIDIEYCSDLTKQNWQDWEIGEENAITLKEDKKTIYVRNTQNTLSTFRDNYVSFSTGVENSPCVLSSGNIMSLINFSNLSEYCFCNLFENCKSLTSSPVLPATNLIEGCYTLMFANCSSLTIPPILNSKRLAKNCYYGMFQNSDIHIAPKLPATTLAVQCYSSMFQACCSLKEAPILPATIPYRDCYNAMFCECSSLERAPLLALKSFGEDVFAMRMFGACTSLSYIKACFEEAMLPNNPGLRVWVKYVADHGIFVCPKVCADKDTYNDFSESTIPVGWTIDNDMSH